MPRWTEKQRKMLKRTSIYAGYYRISESSEGLEINSITGGRGVISISTIRAYLRRWERAKRIGKKVVFNDGFSREKARLAK